MTQTDEKIIDQLRRIRRLAENAGTEGEAAAAAAMMQKLLTKHNLDLSEIPTGEDNDELNEPVEDELIQTQTKQSDYRWREELLTAIATHNFCRVLHTERWVSGIGTRSHIILIGQPHNREVVKFLYEVLTETLVRLSKDLPTISPDRKEELEYYKRIGQRAPYAFSPRRTFLYAAVETLRQRFAAEWRAFSRKDDGTRNEKALVLINNSYKQIDLYMGQKWPKLGTYRHNDGDKTTMDAAAYSRGVAAGRSIPLQRGIGGGAGGVATKSLGSGKRS